MAPKNTNKTMHALLGVHDNLKGQATKVLADLAATFSSKRHLFTEKKKTIKYMKEDAPDTVEVESSIQTTVSKEIAWISGHLASFIDVSYQIDVGNTSAKADIVLASGEVLAVGVPAATLLNLERHRLPQIKALIEAIPTLDPAKGFTPDQTMGPEIGRAHV